MKQFTRILIAAVLVVALVSGYFALTQGYAKASADPVAQKTDDTMRTVQVSGMGEVQAEPDEAVIRLGVQTEAETAQAALNQNSTQMQAVVDTLEEADIPSENIQTQTIRLAPRYEFNEPNDRRTLVGYTASNIVEVRVENLGNLGTLLDQAIKAGANAVDSIHFEISNSVDFTEQARQIAVENARRKAEQLAQFTGATLGSVLEIRETSSFPRPAPQSFDAAAEAAAVPISPGSQSISVEVQVTWTLIVGSTR